MESANKLILQSKSSEFLYSQVEDEACDPLCNSVLSMTLKFSSVFAANQNASAGLVESGTSGRHGSLGRRKES